MKAKEVIGEFAGWVGENREVAAYAIVALIITVGVQGIIILFR